MGVGFGALGCMASVWSCLVWGEGISCFGFRAGGYSESQKVGTWV